MKSQLNENLLFFRLPAEHRFPLYFRVIITLILLLCDYDTFGQESTTFDHTHLTFETVEGDFGPVSDIIQDRDGFLWLAGSLNIIKYNGYNSDILAPGEPEAIFQDSEGLIWFSTIGGITVCDKKTGTVIHYLPDPNNPKKLSGNPYLFRFKKQVFEEDESGIIWIATDNGLNKFDKVTGQFTSYHSKAGDPGFLIDDNVWSLLITKDGSLWVGTETGLHRMDPKTGIVIERYKVNNEDKNMLHGKNLISMTEDEEGIIWIGTTEAGLNRLDPHTKTIQHFRAHTDGDTGLTSDIIHSIAYFNNIPHLIWIATDDGLSILDKTDKSITRYIFDDQNPDPNGLAEKTVYRVYQDDAGIIYFISGFNGILQKFDPGSLKFNSIPKDPYTNMGLMGEFTCPAELGPDGNIWVNEVMRGIARIDRSTGKIIDHFLPDPNNPEGFPPNHYIFVFDLDDQNIVWLFSKGYVSEFNWKENRVLAKYETGTNTRIWPAFMDKKNENLWANAWGDGLLKFNKKTKEITLFHSDETNPEETLSGNTPWPAFALYKQLEGNCIWLLHDGIGFDLFDLESGKVVKKHMFNDSNFTANDFTTDNAFMDSKNRIWFGYNRYMPDTDTFIHFRDLYGHEFPVYRGEHFSEDKNGNLWFAGGLDGTITRLNPETGETRLFTVQDGVSDGLGCSPMVQLKFGDGQIWIAGVNGVTYFNPDAVRANTYQPQVHFTSITQGGSTLGLSMAPELLREIWLPWSDPNFEFEVSALSYRQSKQNQYQYMLVGLDKEWFNAGNRRFGRYSGLRGGSYVLHVRGSNNDGVWSNNEAILKVIVETPAWRTWWFYLLCMFTVVTLASVILYLKYRQLRAERDTTVLSYEMDLARYIQTALLPDILPHDDLDITAVMVPAETVGGDFYDIMNDISGNLWIGIGDVFGHGVTPGLIMLMAQSSFSTSIDQIYNAEPSKVIMTINDLLYENTKLRLSHKSFMTMIVLNYTGDGNFVFSGSPLDIIIHRSQQNQFERVETDGILLGLRRDISKAISTKSIHLNKDDVMYLYTDGIIESKSREGVQLDIDGLIKIIRKYIKKDIEYQKKLIIHEVLNYCKNTQKDDMTLVILKQKS